MPQVKVGWRSGAVSAPSVSAILLDTYSGAAAAYSLRKLSSTYTGSAIRVRRSSDNTELNIGFDANGDLDTVALSAFVGTGNGFVTTWYDQSGNSRDATQTTAGNQPKIVINGVLNTFGTKAAINFDGSGDSLNSPYNQGSTNEMYLVTQTSDTYFVYPTHGLSTYGYVAQNGSTSTALYSNYGTPQLFTNGVLRTPVNRGDVYNILNGYKLVTHKNFSMSGWSGYPIIIGVYSGSADYNGNVQEWLIYPTLQSSQSSIESNINSYYSIYPNPTSVWNLLAAAYNADTTASSSLKTSLFAAYNGESNTNDSFGTNNGTAQGGLTYTTGKIGNAFQFNGTNAYVSLPNNSLNFTGDFSISFWAYYNSTAAAYEVFISNYNNPSGANYGFQLYTDPSNLLIFDLYGGSLQSNLHIPFTPVANTWYMFTVTRKRSTETKVYINGTSQSSAFYAPGSQGATFNQTYDSNQIVNFGSNLNGGALSNIRMDGINFWQKVLTQSEITELYNSGNGAQYIGDNFYKPTTNDALNTYNGTAQGGLTYGLGKVGTAFQFNGTNAYVSLPNNSWNLQTFSINVWVYLSSSTTNSGIFGNYYWTPGNRDCGYLLEHTTSGNIRFYQQTLSDSPVILSTSWSGRYNSWKMITITKLQGSSLKFYVDGVLQTTNYNAPDVYYNSINYTTIGALKYNPTVYAYLENNGKIDALNIWNKVLTQSEITELYNSGNGKQYPY